MQSAPLISLPSEILLHVFSFLEAEELSRVGHLCRKLRAIANSDELWRPIIQACVEHSPPARSANVTPLTNPLPPWDPSFGVISTDRNLANRERWFAVPPGLDAEEESTPMQKGTRLSLKLFPGATSYYEVYWKFIHRMYKLLGWWMGDLPSYGIVLRIIYDPLYNDHDVSQGGSAAFICEKVHLVNRLNGLGARGLRSPWLEATSFDSNGLQGSPSSDGTTIETARLSIDVSVPGVKTEKLWVASWNDVRELETSKLISGTDLAKITWQGGQATRSGNSSSSQSSSSSSTTIGSHNQSSIVSRARALAAQMVFGYSSREAEDERLNVSGDAMDLEEEEEGEGEENMLYQAANATYGQGLTISAILAASSVDTFDNGDFDDVPYPMRTIQQRSGNQTHTVFLSSGAIYTTPTKDRAAMQGDQHGQMQNRLSIRCEKYKPYENSEGNRHRAFGLHLSDHMPLPPIDFPPPALLPLVRDLDLNDSSSSSSSAPDSSSPAFERFLDKGTAFELTAMRMEPCPPYRPWRHLSQPQPSGLRFFPIRSPPRQPVKPIALRKVQGEDVTYLHDVTIPRHLDPGNFEFDWDCLQGLYGMTYGPWGLEVIYIRSRVLTVHDFEPNGALMHEDEKLPRPTGPHGPGHIFESGTRRLAETLHWKPEPYIDVADLQMSKEETDFIRPGCRVIEGVKCSGDANVPRGSISFRAFSEGQDQDSCLSYFSPGSQWSNFPPWDGQGADYHSGRNARVQSPGRVLRCATGRLAMEGFVNAGSWKRCSVKITSADEIHVYWEALRKVAVCKRLTAC
ncbi:hypothetical protein CBS101457_002332 [Exobasidium rhododendri]|nr:hypothetical protein CBS101457_002332 [Exobasidium rhododendri]